MSEGKTVLDDEESWMCPFCGHESADLDTLHRHLFGGLCDAAKTMSGAQEVAKPPSNNTGHSRLGQTSPFKISKSVPIPSDLTLNRQFYPWTELAPGESFFVPRAKVTAMSAKAAWAGRQYGRAFVCRTVKGGVRIWYIGPRDPKAPRKHRPKNAPDETTAALLDTDYDPGRDT